MMPPNQAGGRGRGGGRAAPGGRGRGGPGAKPPWVGVGDKAKANNPSAGNEQVLESLSATLHKFRAAIHVGDRVKDRHSGRLGTCLYVGPADFAKGKEVCGVRLDKARTTTDCDGKYRGERHFRCTPGHGLYIPLEDAEFVGIADGDDLAPPRGGGGGHELMRDNVPACVDTYAQGPPCCTSGYAYPHPACRAACPRGRLYCTYAARVLYSPLYRGTTGACRSQGATCSGRRRKRRRRHGRRRR